ncbi:MAG: class I SAM-dependent methyltransferase [Acidobacteria bacterium]|nr:MAG: class I SAM-dependent methyltransferase [Acidobacteriota bacterium]
MEGFIAKWYATNTGKNLNDFKELAQRIHRELAPGSRVLEVAPGPGYFAIELAKLGRYELTGLDISHTFVQIAQKNARSSGVEIDFRQGNASRMPFADNTFDFLICRAAFKNFSEPHKAVSEMFRVLRPAGRLLLIDLRRDATPQDTDREVKRMGMTGVSSILTKLTFRLMLLKRAYTKKEFEQFFSSAQFRSFKVKEDLIGLEVYAVK